MTLSATSSGERQVTWTRESIIAAIKRWVSLYGEPPRAADWNPSSAKWSAQTWRIERYRAGDPETGKPWPSLNAAKAPFGGSLNEAIKAAGFSPARPGPPKRKAVEHLDDRLPMHPQVRVALDAAQARVRELEETVATRDRQLARARAARPVKTKTVPVVKERTKVETRTVTKTKTKTVRVVDKAAVQRAKERAEKAAARVLEKLEARLAKAESDLSAARERATEARASATRAASKLERAEATISTLREDKRGLARELRDAQAETDAERADAEAAREEAAALRRAQRVVVKDAPEQAVIDAAEARATLAERRAHEAEVRASKAERDYLDIAAATRGERRKLTRAETDELRKSGPAGPAIVKEAITALARAQNPTAKKKALTDLASAAVSWRERL